MTIITNHSDRKITVYPQDDPRQPGAYFRVSDSLDIDSWIKAKKIARDNSRWGPTSTRVVVSDENGNRSYETVDNYWLYGDR